MIIQEDKKSIFNKKRHALKSFLYLLKEHIILGKHLPFLFPQKFKYACDGMK